MSGNTIYRGLCSTCKHVSTCTFPSDPQRPAFYCEEFEIEIAPSGKTGKDDTRQSTRSLRAAEGSTGLVGLCSDCKSSQTCVFPKPEGGVWHCEEYQ